MESHTKEEIKDLRCAFKVKWSHILHSNIIKGDFECAFKASECDEKEALEREVGGERKRDCC
jgi:hypothetical protein